jgi:hypothetical protein
MRGTALATAVLPISTKVTEVVVAFTAEIAVLFVRTNYHSFRPASNAIPVLRAQQDSRGLNGCSVITIKPPPIVDSIVAVWAIAFVFLNSSHDSFDGCCGSHGHGWRIFLPKLESEYVDHVNLLYDFQSPFCGIDTQTVATFQHPVRSETAVWRRT